MGVDQNPIFETRAWLALEKHAQSLNNPMRVITLQGPTLPHQVSRYVEAEQIQMFRVRILVREQASRRTSTNFVAKAGCHMFSCMLSPFTQMNTGSLPDGMIRHAEGGNRHVRNHFQASAKSEQGHVVVRIFECRYEYLG